MMQKAMMFTFILALGIAIGMLGSQGLNAQQAPTKSTELLRTDIVGADGKEAIMQLVEFAPGGATGKHHHPAHSFAYVLEGTFTLQGEGKPPVTVRAGQVNQEAPGNVHEGKNLTTSPLKLLVFRIHPKGQPVTVRVTEPHFVK